MKFIISQVLLSLILISINAQAQEKVGLNSLLDRMHEIKNQKMLSEKLQEFTRDIDLECMKNFFRLPQNEKMTINAVEESFLGAAGLLVCSPNITKAVDFVLPDLVNSNMEKRLNCYEFYLKQLEPESKLLENAIVSLTESDDCKNCFPDEELKEMLEPIEKFLGPLDVFSCGAVSGTNDYIKYVSKAVLIEYGVSSNEVKVAERQKLENYLKNISIATADCMFKRFEANP